MDNAAGEMRVFIAVVENHGFAAAGKHLNMSPSSVSKLVSRIEGRLQTRLLLRSARTASLTAEGEVYYRSACRILADIRHTESMLSQGPNVTPRGQLRISASVPFARCVLLPLIPEFTELYPEIELDFSLNDSSIDLMQNTADIAIRVGAVNDCPLKARKIGESRRTLVASPGYLARYGIPDHPENLEQHRCIGFNFHQGLNEWLFKEPSNGRGITKRISSAIAASDGETVRQLALLGMGIARLASFHIGEDIEEGRLVPLLQEYHYGRNEPINALFVDHTHLAARVRAFVDFFAEKLSRQKTPSYLRKKSFLEVHPQPRAIQRNAVL
ncbi:UNVERIFIED_ORG: DNA-binding transcriptional LysR family regulator [Ensifer adhaerens]|uniref:LysR family transcriptional regulator n=1 Tax=Ensifer canadensis TaxID=555315 RepID=UPI00046CA3D8|nr:LysR family transcriptional regulator [Ensifer canadensis]MDP9632677.1 DNA-binding transcriptional LysR family regulator [Ensifer adhaerens]NOV17799.1 LysR family transcriptional regulator [Ensifer canadensis]